MLRTMPNVICNHYYFVWCKFPDTINSKDFNCDNTFAQDIIELKMPVGINNNHPGPLFKTLQSVKSYAKSEDGELKLIHMASSLGLTRYFFYQFYYKTKTRLNNLKFDGLIYLFIRIDIISYIYLTLPYINIKGRKLTIIIFPLWT